MKHYSFIDGLRAVAVVPVLLYHFGVPGFSGGFIGVDVFFVISGFLITQILHAQFLAGGIDFGLFYERRARRILPAVFVCCAISIAVALLILLPTDLKLFAMSLKHVAMFLSNRYFAKSGYFAPAASEQPMLHTWSLAIEEQFYLIFPLLLWASRRYFPRALSGSVWAVLTVSLFLNLWLVHSSPETTFFLLPTRAWELLAGGLAGLHRKDIHLAPLPAELCSAAGLGALIFCVVAYSGATVYPGLAAILPVAGTVAIICGNLERETFAGKVLSLRPLVAIGLISYGLYMYHWPVYVLSVYYFDRMLRGSEVAIALAGITIAAYASYRWLETPVRNREWLPSRGAVFAVSAAGIGAIFLAGWYGLRADGLPGRFNAAELAYIGAAVHPGGPVCSNIAPERISRETACPEGKVSAGTPGFLLWGDSHSEALGPVINEMALKAGVSGVRISRNGCPPLLRLERFDSPSEYPCAASAEATMRLLRSTGIRTVLLSARWDFYELGAEKSPHDPEPAVKFVEFTSADGTTLRGREAFEASFLFTLKTLRENGIAVWIAGPMPGFLRDVPHGLAKAVMFHRDVRDVDRPKAEVLRRQLPTLQFFDESRGQATFLSPLPYLCPGESCLAEIGSTPLFWDSNHVSLAGGEQLTPMLQPFFDSLR